MSGRVHLVGAGCGAADLITVRGLEVLRHCDAVVYDALIAPELLEAVPPGAKQIPVGKRAGQHSARQEDINDLLIALAGAGKDVVRLKGGDPFVFGRGGEEAQALREAGIPCDFVPGISSALAIPMEAGIPVTHRGLSRSVHIVTAHTAQHALPEQVRELAALDGTLVFLMGLSRLGALSQALMDAGKPPDTPAAVLSGGNASHPAEVRGTLARISALAEAAGVQPPAVIVVGGTAGLDLRSGTADGTENRVGLTGTVAFQRKLTGLLRQHALQPVCVQRGYSRPVPAVIPWAELSRGGGNWLAFTSAAAVRCFFQHLAADGADLRALASCRFTVIGGATAAVLAGYGIRADLCPGVFTGEALGTALLDSLSPADTVWLFDSRQSAGTVGRALSDHRCRRISLYDTTYKTVSQGKPPRYLLFGSAGAVRALAGDGYQLAAETVPVCIGPVCAQAVRQCFHVPPLLSDEITAEAMVRKVLEHRTGVDG